MWVLGASKRRPGVVPCGARLHLVVNLPERGQEAVGPERIGVIPRCFATELPHFRRQLLREVADSVPPLPLFGERVALAARVHRAITGYDLVEVRQGFLFEFWPVGFCLNAGRNRRQDRLAMLVCEAMLIDESARHGLPGLCERHHVGAGLLLGGFQQSAARDLVAMAGNMP